MLLHALGFGIILWHGIPYCVIARHVALGVDATPDAVSTRASSWVASHPLDLIAGDPRGPLDAGIGRVSLWHAHDLKRTLAPGILCWHEYRFVKGGARPTPELNGHFPRVTMSLRAECLV